MNIIVYFSSSNSLSTSVSLRTDIENSRNCFFVLLLVCTAIVAIGVVMEEIVEHREDKNHAWIVKPEWHAKLARLGWLLVIIGVVGEGIFEGGTTWVDTILQDFNNTLLAIATDQAGKANERASNNEVEAARLNRKAAQLRKDAGAEKTARLELQGKVTDANGRVEELRKANNKAASDLEEEKRKRLELAASLLPREFWNQSQAMDELAGISPVPVEFEYFDDPEVVSTAEQINFVISQLHWKAVRRRGYEHLIRDGITISPGRPSFSPSAGLEEWKQLSILQTVCEKLTKALQGSDLEATFGHIASGVPSDTILVSVGRKPNHVLEATIRELGRPQPSISKVGGGRLGSNRAPIPEKAKSIK
jgi:hypothetical protein